MYTNKGNIYADAGKILESERMIGFCFKDQSIEFNERPLDLNSLAVSNGVVTFDVIAWNIAEVRSYDDAKKYVVNKRYSNDSQIAIILNKDDSDEDALAYEKMQEWRAWASIVAEKIMEQINMQYGEIEE